MEPSQAEMIGWVKEAYVAWKTAKDSGDEEGKRNAVRAIARKLAYANAPLDLLENIPFGELDRYFNSSIH